MFLEISAIDRDTDPVRYLEIPLVLGIDDQGEDMVLLRVRNCLSVVQQMAEREAVENDGWPRGSPASTRQEPRGSDSGLHGAGNTDRHTRSQQR